MSKPDELSKHEALHTASIVADMFERHLVDHVAIADDAELSSAAQGLSAELHDFYQLCGRKFL